MITRLHGTGGDDDDDDDDDFDDGGGDDDDAKNNDDKNAENDRQLITITVNNTYYLRKYQYSGILAIDTN